jgi:hypothetical protein
VLNSDEPRNLYLCSIHLMPEKFHRPLKLGAHPRSRSLEDQRVRTRVAALCSARYFFTNLGSTNALGNYSFMKAVTSYSNPDSPIMR